MSTKVKGLLKGLRYISHIFEEEKEAEIQIGYPTDVKHVAHIGWDGHGASVDSPSWMKEFDSTARYQSAPLAMTGDPKENLEIKWVSEDSKSCRGSNSNHNSTVENSDSPKKESSRRHARRSKDSGGSSKSNRQLQDPASGSESPSKILPDIPKKSRRKKSKENDQSGGSSGSSRSSRSKGTGGSVRSRKDEISQTSSSLKPPIKQDGEMESSGIS